jgi:hypothetical protein
VTRVTVSFPLGLDELFEEWARQTGLQTELVGTSWGRSAFEFEADRNARAVLKASATYVTHIIDGAEISN